MNTLLINGSFNINGVTASVLIELMKSLSPKDYTYLQVSDLNISPCIGCLKCRPKGVCTLPYDDGHRIGELLGQADRVIIGAPTYWGNIPGALKILFDRNVTSLEHFNKHNIPLPLHKGKSAFLLVTSSAPWPINRLSNQAASALHSLTNIFKASGFSIKGKKIISNKNQIVQRQISSLRRKISLSNRRIIL